MIASFFTFEDIEFNKSKKAIETRTGLIHFGRLLTIGVDVMIKEYRFDKLKSLGNEKIKEYENRITALSFMDQETYGKYNSKLYGIVENKKNRYIVFEDLGNMVLKEYLLKRTNSLPKGQLMLIAFDIVSALNIYSEMRFPHQGLHLNNIYMKAGRWILGPPEPYTEEDIYKVDSREINYKSPESVEFEKYTS